MKHCRYGDHNAPESEFGLNRKTRDKLHHSCKKCVNQHVRNRYEKYRGVLDEKKQRDNLQVASFGAFFRAAKLGGRDNWYALGSAILGSCNDEYDKLTDKAKQRWADHVNKKKDANGRINNLPSVAAGTN